MAWNARNSQNLQVFRGSRPKLDVFTKNFAADSDCCPSGAAVGYDKLARRVRFDNGLNHLNPIGGNEKYRLPGGDGLTGTQAEILAHINAHGVGAQISVIAIPTFAILTAVGIHIAADEPGLTFNLRTRNGLELPESDVIRINTNGDACGPVRTRAVGSLQGFGQMGSAEQVDLFAIGRFRTGGPIGGSHDGHVHEVEFNYFAMESDEIIVEVAAMPSSGIVTGAFDLSVAVNYEFVHRAEI